MADVRDITDEWLHSMHDDQYATAEEHLLALLRGAANASEGDTITIGPDGTVGRLETPPFHAEHYGHRWAADGACGHCGMAKRVVHQTDPRPCPKNLVPLHRVVTP